MRFIPGYLLVVLSSWATAQEARQLPVGSPLPRIRCSSGYSAQVYARGLRAPDGLAVDAQGRLLVVEEGSG
ncbi:MAG: glucose/arabinose dehydrogenase, partial [Planctomycetota bacterium]